jgi:type I restriction-modification system DNA methylase subunit
VNEGLKSGCPPGLDFDFYSKECKVKFNHAVGNPPFSVKWDELLLQHNPDLLRFGKLKKNKSEQIFLMHMLNSISNRLVMIVPDGLLANTSYTDFRRRLIEAGFPQAVISLPRKIYRDTGTKTSIIIFDKHPRPAQKERVFMAILDDDKDVVKGRKFDTVKKEATDAVFREYTKFRQGVKK